MKKLFLILTALIIFTGCEAMQSEITAIEDYINYFVDIEASRVTGTENTDFTFTANTNDIVESWIIDGETVENEAVRAVSTDNELVYNFTPGSHNIAVLTQNGAMDEVSIEVDEVETIFTLSATTGEATTEFYLDFPILTISGVDYNIETTENLNITETEYLRIVNLQITVDQQDSFCFINDNAWNIYGIDLQNMSIADMDTIIEIFFPERTEPIIPEIPDYIDTIFSLTGNNGSVSDYLTVYDDSFHAGDTVQTYTELATYADDLRYVSLSATIDDLDNFLFVNNNMMTFFNIDLSNMSLSELTITADILNRYPEEGILVLQEEY